MSKGGITAEAQERYERATDIAAGIRVEWEALGSPLLTEGGATGRALVPHPLVKMLAEAERDADRFARVLRKTHAGPAQTAVPRLGKSPAQKLRAVK
jgi:hypothetical protein